MQRTGVTLAQFINYDGYRAIFEAQSKNRMGILLWMSHPCWPSFVWQTYDCHFAPTAGYSVEDADTRGETPRIVVEGFNVAR